MRALVIYPVDQENISNTGVIEKMKGQKRALQSLGYLVDHMVIEGDHLSYNDKISRSVRPRQFLRLVFYYIVRKYISTHSYDLVFVRYTVVTPFLASCFRLVKQKKPSASIVIDVPTYPYKPEWTGLKGKAVICLDEIFRFPALQYVDLICHYGEESTIWGIRAIQITNGIEVEPRKILKPARSHSGSHWVAVGKWQFWHGLDRLLLGMSLSRASLRENQITLSIIGEGPALQSFKNQVMAFELEPYVQFFKSAKGENLEKLIQKADLGIGTLGIHRKGSMINASLKHRTYCAYGVPFILSGVDPDFSEHTPFVRYFSDDDKPIDIVELIAFQDNLQKHKDISMQMIQFASSRLGWKSRMSRVIGALEK